MPNQSPESQLEIAQLRKELNDLKALFFKDNYSDLEVFRKKVEFKSDVTLGSSIGISKDKLGFYGETPIVIPTTAIAEATFVENAGGAVVNVDSTFGGYTLQQIVKSLQNLGLIT